MINAASPDGTVCSAQESVRLPPIKSKIPTTAASAICRAEYQILRPVAAHTGQHHHSGNRKPHRAHQRRRDALHRNINGQVSRAPKQIHQPEGKNHRKPARAVSFQTCG